MIRAEKKSSVREANNCENGNKKQAFGKPNLNGEVAQ